MLVLDDTAAVANGSLHVLNPQSRLGCVITDADFPEYLNDMMSQYTPEGESPCLFASH